VSPWRRKRSSRPGPTQLAKADRDEVIRLARDYLNQQFSKLEAGHSEPVQFPAWMGRALVKTNVYMALSALGHGSAPIDRWLKEGGDWGDIHVERPAEPPKKWAAIESELDTILAERGLTDFVEVAIDAFFPETATPTRPSSGQIEGLVHMEDWDYAVEAIRRGLGPGQPEFTPAHMRPVVMQDSVTAAIQMELAATPEGVVRGTKDHAEVFTMVSIGYQLGCFAIGRPVPPAVTQLIEREAAGRWLFEHALDGDLIDALTPMIVQGGQTKTAALVKEHAVQSTLGKREGHQTAMAIFAPMFTTGVALAVAEEALQHALDA
jgi:hypothetical protein